METSIVCNAKMGVNGWRAVTPIWIRGSFPFGELRVGIQSPRIRLTETGYHFLPDEVLTSNNPFDENYKGEWMEIEDAYDKDSAFSCLLEQLKNKK